MTDLIASLDKTSAIFGGLFMVACYAIVSILIEITELVIQRVKEKKK